MIGTCCRHHRDHGRDHSLPGPELKSTAAWAQMGQIAPRPPRRYFQGRLDLRGPGGTESWCPSDRRRVATKASSVAAMGCTSGRRLARGMGYCAQDDSRILQREAK